MTTIAAFEEHGPAGDTVIQIMLQRAHTDGRMQTVQQDH